MPPNIMSSLTPQQLRSEPNTFLWLCRRIALRIHKLPPGLERDDLIQDIAELLLINTTKFESGKIAIRPFIAWIYMRTLGDLKSKYTVLFNRADRLELGFVDPDWLKNIPDPSTVESAYEIKLPKHAERALRLAIEALPRRQRCVLKSYYLRGLTQREIGRRRGISQPAVHRILYRGLANVRRTLCGDDSG